MTQLGAVHHVRNLEQALCLWADAQAQGLPAPTFTTSLEDWPTFERDTLSSFTIEGNYNGKPFTWRGVVIYVTSIETPHVPTLQ